MRSQTVSFFVLLAVFAGATTAVAKSPAAPTAKVPEAPVLERYPVCEASAALEGPCSEDPQRRCIWVGDNEQEAKVFEYEIDAKGKLTPAKAFEHDLGDARVGDIEALAMDEKGMLLVGSHSRKSNCKEDDDRVAVARVERESNGSLRAVMVAGKDGFADRVTGCDSTMVKLEDAQPGSKPGALRKKFCAALAATEKAAEQAKGDKDECKKAEALNIEGAVSVLENGKPRLWIGLRGPLVGKRAVLLRVAPFAESGKTLSFDGIATIDLGGFGIRELNTSDGWIWGIAGCVPDCTKPSRLWKVPLSPLKSGASITGVEFVNDKLSPSAEGLVIQAAAKRAIVLIDGDEGDTAGKCATAAEQLTLPLKLP